MTLAEFWPQCLRYLHSIMTPQQFDTWIAPLTVGEENGAWVIYGKSQFACNLLKNQFAAPIERARAELAPDQPALLFKVGRGQSHVMAADEGTQAAMGNSVPLPEVETAQMPLPRAAKSAQDILADRIRHCPSSKAAASRRCKLPLDRNMPK